MNMHAQPWSEDEDTTLKGYWLDGIPASEIARKMGRPSRNSIIGRAHRIGLPGRSDASRASRKPTVKRELYTRPKRKPKPAIVNKATGEPPSLRLTIDDLRSNTCRYIAGQPDEHATYCGHRTRPASSYCPQHHSLCWTPVQARR